MDLTKLDTRSKVLAAIGLLALVDSFLPWYSVSQKTPYPGVAYGYSTAGNAWDVGIGGWLPMLLLLAVGVLVALPVLGRTVSVPGGWAAYGAVSLLATVIVVIRWVSYPSIPAEAASFITAGADFGTYLGLLLGLGGVVVGYLGFTAGGGTLDDLRSGAAFKEPQNPAES
ncbi:hypothetical protein [Streptomyces sp. NRRL WC-3742]|uniref:hypothetical protein n=1 Tax=Streptomyces sp. NRRL WC-3742 TaxID=1463934 RepID=UPI0004C72326|nr:hypothetical protein [Streptomyces sp. NRRL WC-3742]